MPAPAPDLSASLTSLRWTATILPLPRGYYGAEAAGLFRGDPVGTAESAGGRLIGVVWRAGKPEKVEPAKRESVSFSSARGGLIAGQRRVRRGISQAVAAVAADSRVEIRSLHPEGFEESAATGTDGARIVGHGLRDGRRCALLWSGIGARAAPLKASDGEPATGTALDGGMIGGAVGWPSRAAVWLSEAAFPTPLPCPGMECSRVEGAGDGQIVGVVSRNEKGQVSGYTTPVAWTSPDSPPVKLLPEGFVAGRATDCRAGLQVGHAVRDVPSSGPSRAMVWAGSADSHVDLHACLKSDWTDSRATFIQVDAHQCVILGEARLHSSDRRSIAARNAVLWRAALE